MPETITQGTPVRFTENRLGLCSPDDFTHFVSEAVDEGDEGIYHCPHLVKHLAEEDWHIIKVGELYCPCHISQFEVI